MGHWEQIGVGNRNSRAPRAAWRRWWRRLHQHGNASLTAGSWTALVGLVLWAFGLL